MNTQTVVNHSFSMLRAFYFKKIVNILELSFISYSIQLADFLCSYCKFTPAKPRENIQVSTHPYLLTLKNCSNIKT